MSTKIVGREECTVKDVVAALSGNEYFAKFEEGWLYMARYYKTDPYKTTSLGRDLLLEKLTLSELLTEIIEDWVAKCGSGTHLEDFIWSLRSSGMGICGDYLSIEMYDKQGLTREEATIVIDANNKPRNGTAESGTPPTSQSYKPIVVAKKSEGFGACLGSMFRSSSELHSAIDRGDMKGVTKLVQQGAYINAQDKEGMNPLHKAAAKAHLHDYTEVSLKIIKFLIDNGADVTAKNHKGLTFSDLLFRNAGALNPAQTHELCQSLVFNGHIGFFNIPNENTESECTPFMWALYVSEFEGRTLKLLYENGLHINLVDKRGWSALFWAIAGDRSKRLLRNLVELGMDIQKQNNEGETPFEFARKRRIYGAIWVLETFE